MPENKRLKALQDKLIRMAKRVYRSPWKKGMYSKSAAPLEIGKFSKNERANEIINNIEKMPHVFVMACMLGRRARDEKAWQTLAFLWFFHDRLIRLRGVTIQDCRHSLVGPVSRGIKIRKKYTLLSISV